MGGRGSSSMHRTISLPSYVRDDGERLHVTLPNGRTRTIPYGTHGVVVGPSREYALQVAEYVRRTGRGTFA